MPSSDFQFKAWFDRFSQVVVTHATATQSEDTAEAELATYTVPANKLAMIDSINLNTSVEGNFTSTTATDVYHAKLAITPTGGSESISQEIRRKSAAASDGDSTTVSVGYAGMLQAGDKISLKAATEGDSAGGGSVSYSLVVTISEFDAA